tara:strand:- start:94 stop:729 length:636 start_codon:yes stop_codon:yes gene_type:complete
MRYLILLISLFVVDLKANEDFIFNKSSNGVVVIFSESSLGSGAIITDSGYVLTNYHVVEGHSELEVLIKNADSYEEAKHTANVIKTDKHKDLALLKITNPRVRLFPIKISKVVPKIGAEAHAIGHPEGLIWSYTKGYISQKRHDYEWAYSDKYSMEATVYQIQTPISHGNSGGPLLNKHGNLIGINTFSSLKTDLINYAVSVEEIIRFLVN